MLQESLVKDLTETATKATTGKVAEAFIHESQVSAAIDKAQRSGSPQHQMK